MDERATALLHDLNDAQREAVTTDAAPLCILAGAGSGKTRVLTRRIAYRIFSGTADGPHVLALTFTRKAADELSQRLASLGVRDQVVAGTFHAVAFAQLRRRWADRGERPPALLDRKSRLLGPLLGGQHRVDLSAADLASEIEWAKARMVPPGQYEVEAAAAGRKPPLPAPAMAAIYQQYETEKRRRGLIDFDDLLSLCAKALTTDPDFTASQRWRFRHLFVDEFQDVNPVQYQLLKGWVGDGADLCVVGDPNQAIYSWNGADPRLLANFGRLFPGGATVELAANYRSTPQVLAVATAVLEAADVVPVDPAGPSRSTSMLRSTKPAGPLPVVTSYATDRAEAKAIAARLRQAHRPGTSWSRLAVLTRTNAQLVLFEEALRAVSIPFRVRGDGAFLRRPEVRAALAQLRSGPRVPFASRLADLQDLAAATEVDDRRDQLQALVRLGRDYARIDSEPSVEGFVAWLGATIKADEPDVSGDAVELVTFHRAKGLEWPVVFLAGLERGFVPIGHAETPDAEAEERRLLYVAITRAEEQLYCSWAERRMFGDKDVPRHRSPWLDVIEAACQAIDDGGSTDWRRYLDRERRRLRSQASPGRSGVSVNPDPVVLAALKEWRAAAARAANVPAYVIFHDTTLAVVAERKPKDRADLLALPGLGPVKAERWGQALLEVVARHSA